MKRDIKSEIVAAATELFNQSGYRAVSMRSIADAMNISVGNLTYHFKRKEDLFEAVMQERHRRCQEMSPPATVAELDRFFRELLEKRRNSVMYAACDKQECSRERTMELQKMAMGHLGELLHGALDALTANGSLRDDPARPYVEEALLGMVLFGRPQDAWDWERDHVEETRVCVWGVLSLLLTERGRAELEEMKMG